MASTKPSLLSRTPVRVRASSLGELFDCPARWEAKHLRRMRMPSSAPAQLGTAVHASTGAYDQSELDGAGLTAEEAAGAAVDAIWKPEEETIWDTIKQEEAEKIALALHTKYCAEVAPTQNYVAVEVTCDALTISDIGITLTGTTDRVRAAGEGAGVSDLKTGKTAVAADGSVNTSKHAMQLGVYELLAEHSLGINITEPAEIVAMQTGKTAKAQRIATAKVPSTREMLIGDEHDPGVLQHAGDMIHAGSFYGNPRSQLCGAKFCPVFSTCKFRR